jgi:tetratricopeptide (TPR) repeat protein
MKAEPDLPSNIFNLAQALSDSRDEQAENEAINLLEDAHESKSDFSFKQRAGQIKIKQLRRKIRDAEAVLENNPDDETARYEAEDLKAQLDGFELEHYRQCVKNYPTDLRSKYEYAVCLMRNQQYDDAIPLFQEAQREPRHRIPAMSKTGLCFFLKGWYTDAVDIFKNAIASHEIKDDNITKELQYNLSRCYEELRESEKALEIYRKIAQYDYAYKDIRQRIEQLRKQKDETTSQ